MISKTRLNSFTTVIKPHQCFGFTLFLIISLIAIYRYSMIKNSTSSLKILATRAIKSRMYSTIEKGSANCSDYRMFFKDNKSGNIVSPFHDIPLCSNKGGLLDQNSLFNMIVEIPRWSNAKMEIATKEPFNPIKQDVKKGKLRYVHNCFPYHGYIWNYGALPQTWESPSYFDEDTKCKGDNDPIDVCEIGTKTLQRGEVVPVKVLGVLALIDDGETDWKLIVIKADDPLAANLNDIDDVEQHMPGLLKMTYEWFKIYKIPDGKPPNKFAFDGQFKNRMFAKNIISETHQQWRKLVNSPKDADNELEIKNISNDHSPFKVSAEVSETYLESQPEFKPCKGMSQEELDEISKVSYIKN